MKIAVIRTGTANLASVIAGLQRAGATPYLTDDAQEVRHAPAVMLPGVGAFGAALAEMRLHGLDRAVIDRVNADKPLISICLGLQLLGTTSEETPGETGLGIVEAAVTKFEGDDILVPQLGWNKVVPTPGARFLTEGYAYFANSYKFEAIPEGWQGAMGDHGGPFVAAIERGRTLSCQFHPELSGDWGKALLTRWLEAAAC